MWGLVIGLMVSVMLTCGVNVKLKVNPTLPVVTSSRRVTPPPNGQNSSICYKYVGCYDTYPPFDNTGGVLPNPPERIGTVFILYTPNSNGVGQQLDYKDKGVSLKRSDFNPSYPTKFVIHGFTQDERVKWLHDIKDALLTLGPINVVIVGWGEGASSPDYPKAVANTRVVGQQVYMLIGLMQNQGMDVSRVHLIGHSLGAHISGYAGARLNGQLGRISAMDPAGPFYEGSDDKVRLNPTDAKFIDVIHSNAKPMVDGGAGMFAPCGHVDFYPNGGKAQPGCPPFFSGILDRLLKFNTKGLADDVTCSHSRSHQLYIESIPNGNHCGLRGVPCASWEDYSTGKCTSCGTHGCSELGYHSIEYAGRGNYYLLTKGFKTAKAPKGEQFCGSAYDILIAPTSDSKDVKGTIDLKIIGTKSSLKTPFQGEDDTLEGKTKIVIVDYQPIGDMTGLTLTYKKNEGSLWGWFGAGADNWKVDYILISQGNNQYKFCSAKPVTVKTETSVKLSRCSR